MNLYVKLLKDVRMSDVSLVGGKNASLGEMIGNLSSLNVNVPNGFAVTTNAFNEFITYNKFGEKIKELLSEIDAENKDLISLRRNGLKIRSLIQNGMFPENIENDIASSYESLSMQYKDTLNEQQIATDVAVRSSSTAEDLQDASFAGQQETYLNVRGKYQLLESIKNCFASLYTDRAIAYRSSINYVEDLAISVCVQKMVRSDMGSAGVAFSIDPETGFKDVVVINGSYGLGEIVVQGGVKPDEMIVFKPSLKHGFKAIIDKKLGHKETKIVYGTNPEEKIKQIPTEPFELSSFCISNEMVVKLATSVVEIEKYYSQVYNRWTPVDIEWAIDGLSGELYIVQSRPETVHSNDCNVISDESDDNDDNDDRGIKSVSECGKKVLTEYVLNEQNELDVIIERIAVGDKIGSGKVKIIHSLDTRYTHNTDFEKGDILVTDMTDPDWEPIMVKASAIITNKGGRTCHASIIARELGITAVVGTGNCTDILSNDELVTVSCANGDVGHVYKGIVPFDIKTTDVSTLPKVKTNIMFNIASPSDVFKYSFYPSKGVGLVREEFIINNFIKVHPLALINYDSLSDDDVRDEIQSIIEGYDNPRDYYVKKLSFGLARIAATFYPNDVIVRFSDFKSNEYKNLLGGKDFEPDEENPMMGWRGASRYYSDSFKEAFGLECKAIKTLREEMGLTNVIVMIPFCRTPEECIQVQSVMKEFGLERGVNGLQVYIMCEVPSNVILADEFCKYVDGFSIGSNDLTQLTLGLDRDSSLVSHIYNERHESVKKMISLAIKACKRNGVKVGICGQGPSDHPDFAKFLVEEGIDSISITPDALLKTTYAIAEIESCKN